jgi:hypothetical protein
MRSLERRRETRTAVSDSSPVARARFVGGAEGRVCNVSARGVLVITAQRTAPGRSVVLHWPAIDALPRLRASVVRCSVARLLGEDGVEFGVALELVSPARELGELATRAG